QRLLVLAEQQSRPDDLTIATALDIVARRRERYSCCDKAEELYRRSLAIRETTLGPNHPDVAAPLSRWASLYRQLKMYAEAETVYIRSREIYEEAGDAPKILATVGGLAGLYRIWGRYAEVEPLLKKQLEIAEKTGPASPQVAQSLRMLA